MRQKIAHSIANFDNISPLFFMQSTVTIQHKTTAQDIITMVLLNLKENKQQSQTIHDSHSQQTTN